MWRRRGYSAYFNSQPHEEADDYVITCDSAENISTHSLTKRLTVMIVDYDNQEIISTHSLTKRLTKNLKPEVFLL